MEGVLVPLWLAAAGPPTLDVIVWVALLKCLSGPGVVEPFRREPRGECPPYTFNNPKLSFKLIPFHLHGVSHFHHKSPVARASDNGGRRR